MHRQTNASPESAFDSNRAAVSVQAASCIVGGPCGLTAA